MTISSTTVFLAAVVFSSSAFAATPSQSDLGALHLESSTVELPTHIPSHSPPSQPTLLLAQSQTASSSAAARETARFAESEERLATALRWLEQDRQKMQQAERINRVGGKAWQEFDDESRYEHDPVPVHGLQLALATADVCLELYRDHHDTYKTNANSRPPCTFNLRFSTLHKSIRINDGNYWSLMEEPSRFAVLKELRDLVMRYRTELDDRRYARAFRSHVRYPASNVKKLLTRRKLKPEAWKDAGYWSGELRLLANGL